MLPVERHRFITEVLSQLAGLPMRDEVLLGWALAIERCLADA